MTFPAPSFCYIIPSRYRFGCRDLRRMPSSRQQSGRLVITVHGIRTFGHWQERLEALVRRSTGNVVFANYKYGYFSVVAFIIPFFRSLVVRKFRADLISMAGRSEWTRIDLVGHSFGTHIIAWAVAGLPPSVKLSIHTVILSGSVLRAGFPWRDLIGNRVGRVVNDCGTRDNILLLSQFFILFTGMAGRTGFSGLTGDVFRNRYSVFGHSGYFQDGKGIASDTYMREHWLPLLLSDDGIPEFDYRDTSAIEGLITTLANNSEPIKLSFYLIPLIAFTLWISGLYLNAERQRLEAERQRDLAYAAESRILADLAKQVGHHDPTTAALIAMEGLPDASIGRQRPLIPVAERQLYDAYASFRELFLLHGPTAANELIGLGNRRILVKFADNSAAVWRIDFPEPHRLLSTGPGDADSFVVGKETARLITFSHENVMRVWDTETGQAIKTVAGIRRDGYSLNNSGSRLATVSETNDGDIWDAVSGDHLVRLEGQTRGFHIPAFDPQSHSIVGLENDGLSIWNVENGAKRLSIQGAFNDARFVDNGTQILSEISHKPANDFERANEDRVTSSVALLDARTGKQASLVAASRPTNTIFAVSKEGSRAVILHEAVSKWTHDDEGEYDLCDIKAPIPPLATLEDFSGLLLDNTGPNKLRTVVLSSGSERIAALDGQGRATLFDWSGRAISSFAASELKFDQKLKWLLIVGASKWVAIDAITGTEVSSIFVGNSDAISSDIDDEFLYTVHLDGTIRVWNYRILPSEFSIDAQKDGGETDISQIQFGPNGATVATAKSPLFPIRNSIQPGSSGSVSVWDTRTGKQLASLGIDPYLGKFPSSNYMGIAYSSDGNRLLVELPNGDKVVWDWKTEATRNVTINDNLGQYGSLRAADFSHPETPRLTVGVDEEGLVVRSENGGRLLSEPGKPM
ncbi:WD40 repeat domain-containing protein [Bradyrhizobium sp. LLZ17]|uniref:WD40 repeat domain-containing protein n=1 Tax=Bradyrhizobium sp. LLZ17 TaxID=3239388 RepID=A0AB39XFE6_9BRAD